tara:strand:- start:1391 stop:1600 length:210 start_codon:yes stop_codon:yes gene_type:complete
MAIKIYVNGNLSKEVKSIIDNGYTVRAGEVSGNSIEEVETLTSYVYYENIEGRDKDLKSIQELIESNEK